MARKKSKVVLVELSPKLADGSRKTVQEKEICSCPDRGTAELIAYTLRNNSSYGKIINHDTCKDNEHMWFISVM